MECIDIIYEIGIEIKPFDSKIEREEGVLVYHYSASIHFEFLEQKSLKNYGLWRSNP